MVEYALVTAGQAFKLVASKVTALASSIDWAMVAYVVAGLLVLRFLVKLRAR